MQELENIIKNIKNKELSPLYFFHGKEPFFIDQAIRAFEDDVLSEDEKSFGQTVLYGKETTVAEVVALARQYPMFGDLNLVIVKEAQDMKLNDAEREILENYAQNPVPTTVLVFGYKYKALAGNTRLAKLLGKSGSLFLSEPMKDYQLPKWIADECAKLGLKTAPNISHMLAEYMGNDLSRISNELEKLKMILKPGEILDAQKVEQHIGISKDYNVFELQKALGVRDSAKAMKVAHYMAKNLKNNPPAAVVANLYTFFCNIIIYHTLAGSPQNVIAQEMGIAPFFIKDFAAYARFFPLKYATRTISVLRETDLKNKGLGGGSTDDADLLREMTYKILNIDKIKINT